MPLAQILTHTRGGGCGCGCDDSDCCPPEGAEALVDYGDLAEALVEGSDLGLGCGMPTRFANLRPGEVVLDLGSGVLEAADTN